MDDIIETTPDESQLPDAAPADEAAPVDEAPAPAEDAAESAPEPEPETAAEPEPEPEPAPEEEPEAPADATPDYLEMTIQSCVLPVDMRFSQINDAYRKVPRAYRTFTYVNSVIEGVISPERYSYAADETERGARLTRLNIGEAIKAIRRFAEAGRSVDFVTARVSPQIVRELDFFGYLKEILDENNFNEPEKLCLEFPRTVLYEDPEKTRMALLAMKLLKVRSLLSGCGEKDSALTPLIDLPFDHVILAPWLIGLADDRTKAQALRELIAYLGALGCGVIADGVYNDAQITYLARLDAYGYVPSSGYKGDVEHGRLRMPLDEALLQSEEEAV